MLNRIINVYSAVGEGGHAHSTYVHACFTTPVEGKLGRGSRNVQPNHIAGLKHCPWLRHPLPYPLHDFCHERTLQLETRRGGLHHAFAVQVHLTTTHLLRGPMQSNSLPPLP